MHQTEVGVTKLKLHDLQRNNASVSGCFACNDIHELSRTMHMHQKPLNKSMDRDTHDLDEGSADISIITGTWNAAQWHQAAVAPRGRLAAAAAQQNLSLV